MDDGEKIAVGYEAGMMLGGAGLNGRQPLEDEYYAQLVRKGLADPAKQAQEMPNRVGIGQQYAPPTPKVAAPLDEALMALADERDSLAKCGAQLTARLQPLLRPVEPANAHGAGGGANKPATPSPLIVTLQRERAAMSDCRRALNDLMRRLDL